MKKNTMNTFLGTLTAVTAAALSLFLVYFIPRNTGKYDALAYVLCVVLLAAIDVGATALTVKFFDYRFRSVPGFMLSVHIITVVLFILLDVLSTYLFAGLVAIITFGLFPISEITSSLNVVKDIIIFGAPIVGAYWLSTYVGETLWTKNHPEEKTPESNNSDALSDTNADTVEDAESESE